MFLFEPVLLRVRPVRTAEDNNAGVRHGQGREDMPERAYDDFARTVENKSRQGPGAVDDPFQHFKRKKLVISEATVALSSSRLHRLFSSPFADGLDKDVLKSPPRATSNSLAAG
jgi:hypothetical protein